MHYSIQTKKKEPQWPAIVGCIIAPLICGWVFVWYDYVLIRYPINYWQFVAISIAFMLCPKWIRIPVGGCVGTVALICQVCAWVGLLTLPIIHLK